MQKKKEKDGKAPDSVWTGGTMELEAEKKRTGKNPERGGKSQGVLVSE